MSAYGHEMEREYSIPSLSSARSSETGSGYSTETGVFMSTFAAMVFLSGIVTLGASLLSLVVALAVMLQSCDRKNSGIIEAQSYTNNYGYCNNFALHAELNVLGFDSFPEVCKDISTMYVRTGQYRRDLNTSISIAEDFFGSMRPRNDGRDIVMMDADDLASENLFDFRINEHTSHVTIQEADYLKHIFVLKLYLKLKSDGWQMILFSRKAERLRNATVELLALAGCHGWSSLIMRKESEMMHMDFEKYLSRTKVILHEEGFRIIGLISSHMDVVRTSRLNDRVFKLPRPSLPYRTNKYSENQVQQQ